MHFTGQALAFVARSCLQSAASLQVVSYFLYTKKVFKVLNALAIVFLRELEKRRRFSTKTRTMPMIGEDARKYLALA